MLRSGLIEWCVQIIAQGRGQGGFIARLYLERIDQRWPQIIACGTQQIRQCADFRAQALHLTLGHLKGAASLIFLFYR